MQIPLDESGPTPERLAKACDFGPDGRVKRKYFDEVGKSKSSLRFTMRDNPLGKAWIKQIISGEEFSALNRYALHWLAAGLQGPLASVDFNRIFSFDPSQMSGLARTEAQLHHKRIYYAAKDWIGFNPSYVADQVACFGRGLEETGLTMGYKSRFRAREKASQYLSSAGGALINYFETLKS